MKTDLDKIREIAISFLYLNIEIDEQNDDSMGAKFYDIDKLKKEQLSAIAIMELEKLGYSLK